MRSVRVGRLDLRVMPGAADAQGVTPSAHWKSALLRSTNTAGALDEARVDHLLDALRRAADGSGLLRRSTLYRIVGESSLDEALFVVMAWGLGTTGQWNFLSTQTRSALHGPYANLVASRQAVSRGGNVERLWNAHFANSPPPGLGSVSFGSKWLHAVGYQRVEGAPQPLIYDENVYFGLTACAGLTGFSPARGRPLTSWLNWCHLAAEVAQEAGRGASPADVEFALFEYARQRRSP